MELNLVTYTRSYDQKKTTNWWRFKNGGWNPDGNQTYLKMFEDVKDYKTEGLERGEHVDAFRPDFPQIRSVRLMLQGHKEDEDALEELETAQRRHAHEQEDSV